MDKLKLLIRNFFVSWKTSFFGIVALMPTITEEIGYAFDADPATTITWTILGPALSGLIALLSAKDGDVSTEEVKGMRK